MGLVCDFVVTPITRTVRTMVAVARTVTRTVCRAVTETLTTVRTVVETVCEEVVSWLPWPFNDIVEWFCETIVRTITVVEEVTRWVCEEVLETIFEWVEVVISYIEYVGRWLCWLETWTTRWVDLLFCMTGGDVSPKVIFVEPVILTNEGTTSWDDARIQREFEAANAILSASPGDTRPSNLDMRPVRRRARRENVGTRTDGEIPCGFDVVIAPGVFGQLMSLANPAHQVVTMYFVEQLASCRGLAIPETSVCLIPFNDTAGAAINFTAETMIHETFHLCGVWPHEGTVTDNIMFTPRGAVPRRTWFDWQLCMVRSSPFAIGFRNFFGALTRVPVPVPG